MKKTINCITINTDASFHPEHKVGGYAFYIVCDLFKIQKGGHFKTDPKTAQEAEIKCIGNAMATLMAQDELPKAFFLIINNDCTYGFDEIKAGSTKLSKKINFIQDTLLAKLGNPKIDYRYVKAHNGAPDARSWVNDWCDNEAKRYMRIAVGRKRERDILHKKLKKIKIGQTVSHEDYSSELFKVEKIDWETGIVNTSGGKNGTWINHIDLIIANPSIQ